MFGLTPRSNKVAPPPPHTEASRVSNDLDVASEDVRRLTQELETVLNKKLQLQQTQDRTPDHNQVEPVAFGDKQTGLAASLKPIELQEEALTDACLDGDFEWTSIAEDEDEQESQRADTMSKLWLKRAQRQDRIAKLQRGTQRLLIAAGIGAFLILTIWPGLA